MLLPYHPTLDSNGIVRLEGRIDLGSLQFPKRHPIILPGNHHLTRILIKAEHFRLLHAGLTLVSASLTRNFCIIKGPRIIRSITKGCVACRKAMSQPKATDSWDFSTGLIDSWSHFRLCRSGLHWTYLDQNRTYP